jgi:N-acyl-D-amino-acid deacylase
MKADLVLFDPAKIIDRATFAEPQLLSDGISMVFVNGAKVWDRGLIIGKLPGLILRRN